MDDTLKISLERTIDNALSSGDCDAMRNAVCVGLKAVISCQASTSKAVHEIQRSLDAIANRRRGAAMVIRIARYIVAAGGGAVLLRFLQLS